VLLLNICVPLIDSKTQPPVFGHKDRHHGRPGRRENAMSETGRRGKGNGQTKDMPARATDAAPVDASLPPPGAAGSAARSAMLLAAFTLVFTAVMALTFDATREPIKASVEARRLELIGQVLPGAEFDNALLEDVVQLPSLPALGIAGPVTLHRARRGGEPVALVFEAQAPDGYSGAIRLLIALRADGTLGGVRVVAHKETPGLGDYVDPAKDRATPKWIAQFAGRDMRRPATGRCARTAATSPT
jgi:electron transport complex protein RnfG